MSRFNPIKPKKLSISTIYKSGVGQSHDNLQNKAINVGTWDQEGQFQMSLTKSKFYLLTDAAPNFQCFVLFDL